MDMLILALTLAAAADGVLIGPRGQVRPADTLDHRAPSQDKDEDGAIVIRPGGEVLDAESLGQQLPAISDATPISLDLQQADIHNVLRLFAAASDINIVTSDDVQGSVTVRLVDVPWDQALSAVLYSLGLAATVYGDRILLVHPIGAP
jgi:hypothetical protein